MDLVTVREASIILGVTVGRVHQLIAAGRLPAEKLGFQYIIKKSDLRLLENRKSGRPPKSPILKQPYFHVTRSLESLREIIKSGLRSSQDGFIYLLVSKDVAAYVARNQLGQFDNYGLIEVSSNGINAEIQPDLAGELTAEYQVRVKQSLISPQHLKAVGMFRLG